MKDKIKKIIIDESPKSTGVGSKTSKTAIQTISKNLEEFEKKENEKDYVYIGLHFSRGGKSNLPAKFVCIGAISRDFKECKKLNLKSLNGNITLLKVWEENIEKIGLNFATYEIQLSNINGISYFYLRIEKKKIK